MKSSQLRLTVPFLLVLATGGAQRVWAITGGQIDDFEDGTVQSWRDGSASPNATFNVATGGNPGRYLEDVSSGRSGPGSKLVMFNQGQWTGDYVQAGVTSIDMDLMNLGGGAALPMRLAISNARAPQGTWYGSAEAFSLPADGAWHTASFDLSADDLRVITGTASLDTVLANVSEVRILASADGLSFRGDSGNARLGVDNITAVTAGPVGPALQAGDSDQDLDFDQLDLVQVQIAAKYLTGQAATWGEGDWNGAPGGEPGAPPAGDGVFNQFDIIAAQQAAIYLTGKYAALGAGSGPGDALTALIDGTPANVLHVEAPARIELASTHIAAAVPVPEPASLVLLVLGVASAVGCGRKWAGRVS